MCEVSGGEYNKEDKIEIQTELIGQGWSASSGKSYC